MKHLTIDDFDSEINSGKVLVDFWATWCGPCRMLAPLLEQLENENLGVKICKVNVDEQPDLAKRFGIMSIPTLLLFKDGKLADKSVGLINLDSLKEFVI
ncbi:MAG: thioredoxin [Clostridiales bacterium]|nr:thioredoxin [Clostridiales bacterium]